MAAEPTIDEDGDGRDPHPLPVAGGDAVAVVVDEQGGGEHQQGDQQAAEPLAGDARHQLVAEAERLPGMAAGLEQVAPERAAA